LIRALNADVPCDQLIREHIAGDLLPNPRWNVSEGFNESMIGTAHFRFVEHGFQPVDALDDQVKVVESQIDVLGKAFQGLTLACARCHDHKFDAVSQRDFYALFGIFASCRPSQLTIDAPERLRAHAEELRSLKEQIKKEMAHEWLAASREIASQLLATLSSEADSASIEDELLRKISSIEKELTRSRAEARARAFRRVRGDSATPVPVALWTFEGDAKDALGGLDGELVNGARIEKGKLILDGKGAFMRTSPLKADITEKTFEAWVTLSKRDQQGGGVITLQTLDGTVFDSIVFAEREPGRWVAGSEFFRRSRSFDGLIETLGPEELVHIAIVYTKDNRIAAYRNGVLYGKPYISSGNDQVTLQRFLAGKSEVLLGLRHVGGANAYLEGAIDAAALYDRALSAEEIAASFKAGAPAQRTDEIAYNTSSHEKALRLSTELTTLRIEFEKRFPDYEQKRSVRKRWMTAVQGATNQSSPLYLWNHLRMSAQNTNDLRELFQKAHAQPQLKPSDQTRWELAKLDSDKWFRYGINGPHHAVTPGEFAIDPEGKRIISGIYPPGVFTHLASQKHNGVFASARFKVETDYISVRAIGGKGARVRLIVENYPIGAEGIYPQAELKSDGFQWVRLDTSYRKGSMAYLEFATADEVLSRTRSAPGPGGRSWFGVEAVVFHNEKAVPSGEPFEPDLLHSKGQTVSAADLASRYQSAIIEAVESWTRGDLTVQQQQLLDYFVRSDLLPNSTNSSATLAALVRKFRSLEADIPVARRAPGMLETVAADAALLERGDHLHPKEPVPRRYLEVLGSRPYTTRISGRLELADELSSPANPLTARVMVNRIWHHLFGRGLVTSVDNFGRLGEKPSHPELLDYLAAHFIENGWSIKEMIRFLVSSRAYQTSSEASDRAREIDPANELLSHMRVRRLEAESVRDSLLAISGRLDEQMFGPSVNALAPPAEQTRRSIYMSVRRTSLSPFLQVFDAPKPFTTIGRREPTNVPAQSLALLNDPFIIELASHWAAAVLRGTAESSARVSAMFEQAFGRPPREAELVSSKSFLEQVRGEYRGAGANDERVWRDFAQSLFNFKEFIYVK
jgi:hypothetical protein